MATCVHNPSATPSKEPDDLRYRVIAESVSNHCCFSFTVVEVTPHHPDTYQIETYGYSFNSVCECFDDVDAENICDALNMRDQMRKAAAAQGGKVDFHYELGE